MGSSARAIVGAALRHIRRVRDTDEARVRSIVVRGMQFPRQAESRRVHGSVWAVTMVKNELDILPRTLEHFLSQGVDRLLIADNGSTDGTLEMLRDSARDPRIIVGVDSEPAYYQSAKMTYLARFAGRAGADWIIPFDADEFWFARDGLLADNLRGRHDDVVLANLNNVFPTTKGEFGLDPAPNSLGKVAFRSHPWAWIGEGNHRVDRLVSRSGETQIPLEIAHVPWRSFEQFERKLRQGSAAYRLAGPHPGYGHHWRHFGEMPREELVAVWTEILAGQVVEGLQWSPSGLPLGHDPTVLRTWRSTSRSGEAEDCT